MLHEAIIITSPDPVQFIIDHIEKADQITTIVIERKTDDVDLIASIINSDSPPLTDGRL